MAQTKQNNHPQPAPAAADANEGRRARRRRELHDRIFQTAREMFLERGFDATTVEQIAAEADIAPATFFNHFPTKDDVLREMAGDVFERFRALVDEQRRRKCDTRERLLGFADRAGLLVERAPELTRKVLLDVFSSANPGESERRLGAVQEDMVALLREGQAGGDLRADGDPELCAELLLSAVLGSMTKWINNPDYALRERLRRSAEFLADAMAAPAGTSATSKASKKNRK